MIKSKAWDWSKNKSNDWLVPSIEACYLSESWKSKSFNKFLDLGCGLGRHSIYFAKKGFEVNSLDLSEYGVNHLKRWAEEEQVDIAVDICDMLNLPFKNDSFDCIMAYNVIYHTDTDGFIKSLDEIKRVLKSGGELFITLLSKDTWSYQRADNYKRIDNNTILRDEHDTERDVPHFYVDIEDIKKYFIDFEFVSLPIEQTEYNMDNTEYFSKHFNLIVRKKY
ncbi:MULTISPECIES: class I SAM-dependent methyltransferase [unclassified Clostridium]|uniref:class I SAM-dependent methyltransferase n=1 Tax=unclassified Clostridium TaxID=2614128 RepID=UPI0013E90BE3|nr:MULTISPECIES: class I SAM-dependent methyltransferase [unclassified Clostridium]MBZ9623813.1 class I SAM-dependent methyltransferase [Clostridium sp. FP2]MBZ9635205.1 class I SAM-dependent methyltransferase [Clostridium sp. FP1]